VPAAPTPFTDPEEEEVDEQAVKALMKAPASKIIADLVRGPYVSKIAERYGLPKASFAELVQARGISLHQPALPLPDECEWIPEDEPSYHRRVEAGEDPEAVSASLERIVRMAVRMEIWHIDDDGVLQRWDREERRAA
jgi:hypothetical protein